MSNGGRPATGSIEWRRNEKTGVVHWHARISLADGTRPFVPLDPRIPRDDREAAKAGARDVAEEARRIGAVPAARETVIQWFGRFHKHKAARGRSSVGDMRGRAAKWILPTIGDKDMSAVTREDIEAIVRRLDAAIVAWEAHDGARGEGRLSPSTTSKQRRGTSIAVASKRAVSALHSLRSRSSFFSPTHLERGEVLPGLCHLAKPQLS